MSLRPAGALLSMAAFLAVGGVAQMTQAHFVLEAPAAMTEQNDLGDPQKAPNCGDDGSAVMTGMLTSYAAGDTIDITINEQIYHPGHYRVALVTGDPSELPDAPPVTSTPQDDCAMTEIDADPQFPILADGMLAHSGPFDGPQTFQVTVPADIECENCTLQVIQYMSSHGAPCFYYHCANITVTAAKGSTTTDGPETTGAGDDTTGVPPSTTGDDSTSASPSASESDSMSSADPSDTGDDNPTTTTTTPVSGSESGGQGSNDDDGGCSIPSRDRRGGPAVLVLLGGLLAWRRRR